MFIKRLSICMLVVPAFTSGSPAVAIDREEYVDSVILILRTHTELMEAMAEGTRFRYSDNLVRHANQIRETFGLLGPMEWHAAEAAALHSADDDVALDEEKFDSLASASRRSLTNLVRAAHDSMERYDREGLLDAIATMKQSCMNCHNLLPEYVAPRVWDIPPGE